jgi:hypothetical protein
MQLGDDAGNRVTHARDFLQALLGNQILQGFCESQQVFRRARVGLRAVGVATS